MVESFTGVQVQHAVSMRSLFMQSGECVQPFFILVFLSRFRYFATSICVSVAVDANEYYVCILVPHKCIDEFAQPVAITRLSVYFYTIVYDAHHVPINHASALHSQCKYSLFECCLPHTTRVAARRDHQRGLILRLSVICALCIWLLGDNKRPTTEQCEWCAGAFREPSQPKRVAGVISSSSTYSWVRTKDLHHFQSILFTFGSVLTFAVTSWRWSIECLVAVFFRSTIHIRSCHLFTRDWWLNANFSLNSCCSTIHITYERWPLIFIHHHHCSGPCGPFHGSLGLPSSSHFNVND